MKRNCELCGCAHAELLFPQRFSTIEDSGLLRGYDVVVCESCGFGFADNIPEQAEFDSYYKNMSKYEYDHTQGQVSSNAVANYQAIVDFVEAHLKSKATKILDIGCATGQLLAVFKERGYSNVTGADPSPRCAEIARQLYGVNVLTAPVSQLLGSGLSFDLILLSSVLEHIRDASTALAQIAEMLTPGGLLFIEVPDVVNFSVWAVAPFQQFSIEHINFFSPISLERLLSKSGFSVVAVSHDVRLLGEIKDPSLTAIFRKGEAHEDVVAPESETRSALLEYIETSRRIDAQITTPIANIAESGKTIMVWGVGTHTLRLLETSRLADVRISAFIDSNPNYQARELRGAPIIAPKDILTRPEPILISSKVYQDEIVRQIRELGCQNKLITLY